MGKACWACKKKKVRCGLEFPTCLKCVSRGTRCEYGTQLSWPRNGDSRRSVTSQKGHRSRCKRSPHGSPLHFLSVDSSDVTLHYALTSEDPSANGSALSLIAFCKPMHIPQMLAWIPSGSSGHDAFDDETLISYYESFVAATFTHAKDSRLQRLVLSMSFNDSSSSSIAVRQALYALTALHLRGFEAAMRYAQKARHALHHSYSSQHGCTEKDRLQQITAELLFTVFELHNSSNRKSVHGWAQHACNAKTAANQVYSLDRTYEGDARSLLEWIFYHDALSRFSASHWAQTTSCMHECMESDQIRRVVLLSGDSSKIINTLGCSAEVLETITRVYDHVRFAERNSRQNSIEQIQALERLERRLKYAKQVVQDPILPNKIVYDDNLPMRVAELYRLAGLVYLYRAAQGLHSTAPKVQNAVKSAYRILKSLSICDRTFPLTILGCEAQNDADRLVILRLISRTRACRKFGNIGVAHRFIEASWAQDDLNPDQEVDYVQKFNAIMSRSRTLPSFA